jgi:hypothetical protein
VGDDPVGGVDDARAQDIYLARRRMIGLFLLCFRPRDAKKVEILKVRSSTQPQDSTWLRRTTIGMVTGPWTRVDLVHTGSPTSTPIGQEPVRQEVNRDAGGLPRWG